MRNKFAETFYEIAKQDGRQCVIVADISPAGSIAKFREEFPARFINTGVAEQVMVGMAAGMSQRGLRPFCYTIATFALYRPFEMVRNDLAYQGLPVTVVGIGGGVSYSTLGATHHAMEDIAIASAIPGMTVIAPCDPLEVEAATRWCAQQEIGPVYLRLGKAGEPNLTEDANEPWKFGKVRKLYSGSSVCLLSYGPIMGLTRQVRDWLKKMYEVDAALFCVHTLKPLDRRGLSEIAEHYRHIIVIEETTYLGSLAQQLRALTQRNIMSFTLVDDFAHVYGSHADVLEHHGLNLEMIVDQIGEGFGW